MNLSKLANQDNFIFGLGIGIVTPVPVVLIFVGILILIQHFFYAGLGIKQTDMALLGLVANLILMRHYFVRLKYEQTGRGLIFISLIYLIVFFVFLRNSNFSISF